MYVAMNRFKVRPEAAASFEQMWLKRETRLPEVAGFLSFHMLRGPQREDHILFSSYTLWASREAFEAWTKSPQFASAHKSAASKTAGDEKSEPEKQPMTIGPSQFEGFDVLQVIDGKPIDGNSSEQAA